MERTRLNIKYTELFPLCIEMYFLTYLRQFSKEKPHLGISETTSAAMMIRTVTMTGEFFLLK